ncbi:MAG: c-type cytochrome, partial [Verrucomicrobia bacterium]|nr:c-type cytochrome [Verrucomicrobiota bacterium]
VSSQAVWPSRITAGVNRGYQPATLGPDHRLANFTAACGTLIYRGDNLPSSARNHAFVCEPSANLIRLQHLWEDGPMLRSSNGMGRAEFLTSTDERFRPVNLIDGPDGGLYVIDIGRGVIQHRIYMTTYLRKQVEDRGLDKPLEVGRLYRITHRQGESRPRTKLSRASSAELVALLKHPNGWHRDTAQRLLVERADASVVSALSDLARRPGDVRFRLHAFWTLEGMGKMEAGLVEEMLLDSEPWIQRTGLRFAEPYLKAAQEGKTTITKAVQQALWNKSLGVRVQAALSLGVAGSASNNAAALKQLHEATGSEWLKQAAALGLGLLDAKTNTVNAAQLASMSDAERKRFQAGKEVYSMVCGACHQPHGLGQEGLAPPLAESEWTGGSPDRLIRMVLHGVRGPIKVKGQTYQLEMPPLNILNDDQVADVLTYIRKEWGHSFSPVSAEAVKAVRDATAQREQAWTEEELLKLP